MGPSPPKSKKNRVPRLEFLVKTVNFGKTKPGLHPISRSLDTLSESETKRLFSSSWSKSSVKSLFSWISPKLTKNWKGKIISLLALSLKWVTICFSDFCPVQRNSEKGLSNKGHNLSLAINSKTANKVPSKSPFCASKFNEILSTKRVRTKKASESTLRTILATIRPTYHCESRFRTFQVRERAK